MSDLLDQINRYGVRKVPGWFWLIVGFQARYWMFVIAAAASVRRSPAAARLLGADGVSYLQLALEFPILLLAYAAISREPGAGPIVRAMWSKGREIITLTAAINLMWVGWYVASATHWRAFPDNFVVLCGVIDLMIVALAWTSAALREAFAQFPAPRPTDAE